VWGYGTEGSFSFFFFLFFLFGIARAKDTSVAYNMELLSDSTQWNVNFVREAHDWEVEIFASSRCRTQSL
jgi:hypothetical protein